MNTEHDKRMQAIRERVAYCRLNDRLRGHKESQITDKLYADDVAYLLALLDAPCEVK